MLPPLRPFKDKPKRKPAIVKARAPQSADRLAASVASEPQGIRANRVSLQAAKPETPQPKVMKAG
ncbi:MAG: hypothetical protein AAFV26_03655 [Pseudomonadota bacterium]